MKAISFQIQQGEKNSKNETKRKVKRQRRMYNTLMSVVMSTPAEGQPRQKQIKDTKFIEHWPANKVQSKWYFATQQSTRVHLKVGWNLFGRRDSNNIRIMERAMLSCEVNILVSEFDCELPTVYNVNGNIILNGERMEMEPQPLFHESVLGIFIQSKSKLVIIEFFKAGLAFSAESD